MRAEHSRKRVRAEVREDNYEAVSSDMTGSCMHKLSAAVDACIRPAQDQCTQYSSTNIWGIGWLTRPHS